MKKMHKLVLYNKTVYRETALSEDCRELTVGTLYGNDIRLKKELFFDDFGLTILNHDDLWEAECSSNVFISSGDSRKLLRVPLEHGDEYGLRYQGSDSDFLKILFLIDFDYGQKNIPT